MEGFEASDAGALFQPLRPVYEGDFERSHAVNFQDQGDSSISNQNADRQQHMAAQKNPVESAHAAESQQSERAGATDKYTDMIMKVEDMQKTLATVKETLTQASVQCHMYIVDMVTLFNPETVETLNGIVEDCEACMRRMATQVVSTDL